MHAFDLTSENQWIGNENHFSASNVRQLIRLTLAKMLYNLRCMRQIYFRNILNFKGCYRSSLFCFLSVDGEVARELMVNVSYRIFNICTLLIFLLSESCPPHIHQTDVNECIHTANVEQWLQILRDFSWHQSSALRGSFNRDDWNTLV